MVLGWRNSDRIRKYMYTDHIISWDEHQAWYNRIKDTGEQILYIFEREGHPVGFFNVTHINRAQGSCSFGLYVGEPDMPKGTGSALGYCGMEEMIEHLKFKRVIGEVFSFNKATIDFNIRLGFIHEEGKTRQVWKNGQYETILIFDLFPDNWLKRKPELAKLIFAEEHAECVR
jgi:UDP-4-amino-4,6-dideoxy-N-acetyl-beta-L-altrosamine N-acetyltransferase